MAVDLTPKKRNYLSRLQAAVNANTDQVNGLVGLYTEGVACGFFDPQSPNAITDADLNEPAPNGAPAPFPALSAADLGKVGTSLAAVKTFLDANGHTAHFLLMRQ